MNYIMHNMFIIIIKNYNYFQSITDLKIGKVIFIYLSFTVYKKLYIWGLYYLYIFVVLFLFYNSNFNYILDNIKF